MKRKLGVRDLVCSGGLHRPGDLHREISHSSGCWKFKIKALASPRSVSSEEASVVGDTDSCLLFGSSRGLFSVLTWKGSGVSSFFL